jgi:hypothetical protein
MEGIASSDDKFSQWFRERVRQVHGINLAVAESPGATKIHDYSF